MQAMSVCVLEGRIYAAAGWCKSEEDDMNLDVCNDMEVFDPFTKTWSVGASIQNARAQAATCVYDGCMWVVGGFGEKVGVESSFSYFVVCEPVTAVCGLWWLLYFLY